MISLDYILKNKKRRVNIISYVPCLSNFKIKGKILIASIHILLIENKNHV